MWCDFDFDHALGNDLSYLGVDSMSIYVTQTDKCVMVSPYNLILGYEKGKPKMTITSSNLDSTFKQQKVRDE